MLKGEIHDPVWFFDLEWVPDAAGAIRLFDLPADTTEIAAMERLWQETNGYDAEKMPRPFVKYIFSRVVSIAFLSRRVTYDGPDRKVEFGLHSLPKLPLAADRSDEGEIISDFLHYVGVRNPQLVGFNSAESDLQVLIQRSLVNDVRAEAFSERPNKPWEGRDYFDSRNSEAHLDLLQRFSRGAMTPQPMCDDGKHGDGAANDGVYGAWVPAGDAGSRSSATDVVDDSGSPGAHWA